MTVMKWRKMLQHQQMIQYPTNLKLIGSQTKKKFDSHVSPRNTKTLASSMCSGLCHTQLNALDFFQDNSFQDQCIYAPINFTSPNTTSVSVVCVWVLMRMKPFLHLRRRFSNKHWKLVITMFRIHDDVWAALWRTKWHLDYFSSCHSQAKICFG